MIVHEQVSRDVQAGGVAVLAEIVNPLVQVLDDVVGDVHILGAEANDPAVADGAVGGVVVNVDIRPPLVM